MNTTGCAEGLFTDQFYNFYASLGTCSESVAAFVTIMSLLIILRFLIFLEIARLWMNARRTEAKRRKERGQTSYGHRRRLPIIPTLHFMSFVTLVLLLGLLVTQMINAKSGLSHLIMMVWFSVFAMIEGFALRKMVHLGRTLIPWNGALQNDNIAKFDRMLRFLVGLMLILFFTAWVTVIIGCFYEPVLLDQISLLCVLFQQVFFFSALVYQYERCLRCIASTRKLQQQVNTAGLSKAWFRMRFQQAIMLVAGVLASGTLAFFGISLRSPWWGPCISFSVECFSYGLIAYSLAQVKNPRHQQDSTSAAVAAAMVRNDAVTTVGGTREVSVSKTTMVVRQGSSIGGE